MEVLVMVDWQTPCSWGGGFTAPDLGVFHCSETKVDEWGGLKAWGSVDFPFSEKTSSSPYSCMIGCRTSPLPMVSSRDQVALELKFLLENWRSVGKKFDGCCLVSELLVRCLFVDVSYSRKIDDLNHVMLETNFIMVLLSVFPEILDEQRCVMKLGLRGVFCVSAMCFFCMMETRLVDDLAEDGDSRLFGLIHRWHVRASSLLIPRFDERESFRLGSVLDPQDLQLNRPLPRVHLPARLPGESPALRLASTTEAFEDYDCGSESDISQLTHHQTPVIVFPVFGLLVNVLVYSTCEDAPMYPLLLRAL